MTAPIFQNGVPLPFAFAGGLNTPQFSAADLNGDGTDDLVAFDRSGDVVLTFLNAGTPNQSSYSYAPQYASFFPKVTDYMLMRDFNQDGAADIFCASLAPGSQEMQVFQGYFEDNTLKFNSFYFNYPNCTYCNPLQVWFPDQDQPGFWNNLPIAPTDMPAVDDIDGDGDLDILTFDPAGGHIWFVQNQSVELGFGTDSLRFRLADKCWGRFYESGLIACESDLSPNQSACVNGLLGELEERTDRHPGSTLMTYDADGDNDKEIVLGDVSFDCLNQLNNGGSAAAAWMTSQDINFPSGNTPVSLSSFPAAFYLDLNNDGKQDMVVSPNNRNIGEDQKNVWYYRNAAATGHSFELQNKTLLVGDMLDLGSTTHPTFADVNADGLEDLVVGTYGFYSPQASTNARLYLLLNTGTGTNPQFTLSDTDWLGLSEFTPDNYDFSPAFGDVDGDGDQDLIVGHNDGGFFCYRNAAGPGIPMNLSRDFSPMWQNMDVVGLVATPTLVDLTGDGLPDIVAGERNGNINLFENTGSATNPQYPSTPTIQKLGFVDTRLFGEAVGFSTPVFINTPTGLLLVAGTNSGQLEAYQNFSLTDTFDLVDPLWGNVDEGSRTHPAFADLDNDGILEMVVGNLRGGLSLFKTNIGTVALQQPANPEPVVHISPNPARDWLSISVQPAGALRWRARNALGQLAAMGESAAGPVNISTKDWQSGIYFIEISVAAGRVTRKVAVE
ncbi:MAG: T9SS type A sorting domain-containing protein [Lewinellaceae bacterium]|nr:T9SS type A sorting domain-containing protein [Lewinellaceae bacterium]